MQWYWWVIAVVCAPWLVLVVRSWIGDIKGTRAKARADIERERLRDEIFEASVEREESKS